MQSDTVTVEDGDMENLVVSCYYLARNTGGCSCNISSPQVGSQTVFVVLVRGSTCYRTAFVYKVIIIPIRSTLVWLLTIFARGYDVSMWQRIVGLKILIVELDHRVVNLLPPLLRSLCGPLSQIGSIWCACSGEFVCRARRSRWKLSAGEWIGITVFLYVD